MHHFKKLVPVFVILAAFAVLVTGVGFLRPKEHVARCQVVLRKPVEEVWPLVGDLTTWPGWLEAYDGMRRAPKRNDHDTFLAHGSWGDVAIEIERSVPPYELVTFLTAKGFSGRWSTELEIVPAGTQITITEYGEVSNPFLRGLMLLMDEHGSMKDFLRDLAAKLEVKGEPEEKGLTLEQYQVELTRK